MEESLNKSEAFFLKYKKAIIAAVVALIVIIAGVVLYKTYVSEPNEQKASTAIAKGQEYFAQGQFEKALKGDSLGYKGFVALASDYSSTAAGNLANLYAGLCNAQLGQWDEAVKYLEGYDGADDQMITPAALGALWAPTAGIMWPFGSAIAFARCAVQNGAEVIRNCGVTGFVKEDGAVTIVNTTKGPIRTRFVINAAGVYADEMAKLAGDDSFTVTPRKGEYILFDKTASSALVKGIVFPCPSEKSKGILICATTHGNTFIGPNAREQWSKEDTSVTPEGMEEIMAGARKLIPNLPMGASITGFAGLRAVSDTGDFILGPGKVPGFFNAAGIQSPGLTAAPAIAEVIVEALGEQVQLVKKKNWKASLPKKKMFSQMTDAEKKEAIAANPLYGRVICRCETVTEGEIVDAIHEPVGAVTLDGVKRRTRAGMGRCQGGFCGPRVVQILARELNIPVEKVLKERQGSELYYKKAAPEATTGCDLKDAGVAPGDVAGGHSCCDHSAPEVKR